MQLRPELPVIMMSGHGTIETAVKATQLGARDFLEKPIARERLLVALRNALEHQAVVEELTDAPGRGRAVRDGGQGPGDAAALRADPRTAPSEGRVLITGENGTRQGAGRPGASTRTRGAKAGPFVKLNCAAVPHELIESELFGHEKGAFTGAVSVRRGKFELAHERHPFLDEIGDMPAAMQAKLLRVLQEGELERVGGSRDAEGGRAGHRRDQQGPRQEIAAGRFREDLYYRLNVVQICTARRCASAGRTCRDLIDSFLEEACRKNGKRPMQLSPEALAVLERARLPGQRARAAQPGRAAGDPLRGAGGVRRGGARTCCPDRVAGEPPAHARPSPRRRRAPAAGARAAPRPAAAVDKPFRDQVEDAEREIILHDAGLHQGQRHRGGEAARPRARALLQEDEGPGAAARLSGRRQHLNIPPSLRESGRPRDAPEPRCARPRAPNGSEVEEGRDAVG